MPTDFKISEVVNRKLSAGIDTITVPSGYSLILTSMQVSPTSANGLIIIQEGTDTISFYGYSNNLTNGITFILGEGMKMHSEIWDISLNGFYTPTNQDIIVKSLPYTNSTSNLLYLASSLGFNDMIAINGIPFRFSSISVLYPGQTLTGEGAFIGYFR